MNVVNYPIAYQSAFRPVPFVLGGVSALSGLDVSILPASGAAALGVKRVYGDGGIAVNVAPYVRSLLSPEPLCGQPMGMIADQRRCAGCRVSAGGYTSDVAYLTAGTEDAPANTILSASPTAMKIRPGEKDEMSVITAGAAVKPFIVFTCGGVEYTVDSMPANSGEGMHSFVVDAAAVAELFAAMTNAGPGEMDGFDVVLRVSAPEGDIYLTRRYEFDAAPHNGRRLAWVNRYGAVDYYTFPAAAGQKVSGSKERITTADGVRVVASSAVESLTLVSEYEAAETLGWLGEVLSSPRVWMVEGGGITAVDVADASVGFDHALPGSLAVTVIPVAPVVSRKF